MPEFNIGDRVKRVEGIRYIGAEGVVIGVAPKRWINVLWDNAQINELHRGGQWDRDRFVLVAPAPQNRAIGVTVNEFKDVDGADMVMISCTKEQAIVISVLLSAQGIACPKANTMDSLYGLMRVFSRRFRYKLSLPSLNCWKFLTFEERHNE